MPLFSWITKLFKEDIKDIKQEARHKRRTPSFIRHLTEAEVMADISRAEFEREFYSQAKKELKKKATVSYIE